VAAVVGVSYDAPLRVVRSSVGAETWVFEERDLKTAAGLAAQTGADMFSVKGRAKVVLEQVQEYVPPAAPTVPLGERLIASVRSLAALLPGAIDAGTGVIVVMPHLGGWEWAGIWTTLVKGYATTVVVEAVEPPSLFEFFASFRRELGLNIVPLGPSAATEILQALAQNHVVCLLADRDIPGDGIELEMFGEVTTIPAGPAMLALRSGAPLITAAVYFTGEHGHRGVVQEPLEVRREGRLRDDVTRVTIEIANRLEELIARAPEQWHLQQPNWPSDYDFLEAIGKPHPRPTSGPASRAPGD
jgi:hypothetical protein